MLGRRAFGSKVFEKAKNSVLRYKIDVFLDDRKGTGLSVDRLGIRKAQPDVLTFLGPLCDKMADKRPTEFVGWAQIRATDFGGEIRATMAVGEDNRYHAEIDRSQYQTDRSLRSLAFELCVHASKHEFIPRSVAFGERD